ncbi:MAG: carbohydrate binding family 9 domain-containing protein, partial [Prolixibacteraceae bacterium]|nr:carbohydrate binding family 9 domain-containing protein [Prolixibacteraceae bacterium]
MMNKILPCIFAMLFALQTVMHAEIPPVKGIPSERKVHLTAKKTINQDYKIHIGKIFDPIKLDGVIDEKDWLKAETASNFYMVLPYDTGHCVAKSEVKMLYDDKAFYLAVVFHDTLPGKRPVESYRRDFTFANNDNFLVFIDPFNDQTTGYSFGVNAVGAMWDGSMSGGSASNLTWDCKWEVKTKNYPDKWTAEFRIPFKSVRYKNGLDQWNIQFSRQDLKLNEKSAWAPVPRQFPTASLAYAGQLIWQTPPPKSGLKLSLIPYLYGSVSRDFEKSKATSYRKDFGIDAKLGLSSSLNLDLTYNPDFSQAEVDDQVTNLERFELYFPEKRQFFLENSDLFGNFGSANVSPFFSRRIGLDAPVNWGARLSGKIGKNWRIGMMDMQTGTKGEYLSRNFYVASIQKKLFSRSNIGAIFVNKQQLNVPDAWTGNSYNRVAGLEYNLASKNNFWNAKLFGQKS